MGHINAGRVISGGVVAGIILFVTGGIIHGAILGADWKAWAAAMGPLNHPPAEMVGMAIWGVVSLINGITGVWIYAGIRPRYGAGPKTALIAGLLLWLAGWLAASIGQFNMGNVPTNVLVIGCLAGLVAVLVATLAGAFVYKESA
jgi:hypothetical protein